MAKTKRYKPAKRAICAIGTLAHNRGGFTIAELRQYVRYDRVPVHVDAQFGRWLAKHGHIRKAGSLLALTPKGWKMVESACRAGR